MDLDDLIKALTGARDQGRRPECQECNELYDPSADFCFSCGARLRFPCPRCRDTCRQADAYCTHCGLKLTKEAVSQSVAEKARDEENKRRRATGPMLQFSHTKEISKHRYTKLRATRHDTGEARFLKVAKGSQASRLLRNEGDVLKAVTHPNVVKLFEAHRHFDDVVLELEYIESQRLRYPLSVERLCHIMHDVAQALAAIHRCGYLHADLKPQNILVRDGDRNQAVVVDLEVSQPPGPSKFKAVTPLFSPPEQIVGDHIDYHADVYAFGITFYLLFFYERMPSIVDLESPATREMGKILQAVRRRATPKLLDTCLLDGYGSMPRRGRRSVEGYATSDEETLGAKYHFAAELERVTSVNRRLDVMGTILSLICETTEIDPDRRPPDGAALVERTGELIELLADGGRSTPSSPEKRTNT